MPAETKSAPLTPFSFKRRDPGPSDVVVEIAYSGICHSDIHQVRDEWGGSMYPMVPGHEIVGHVTAVGAGRDALQGRRPCRCRRNGRFVQGLRQLQGAGRGLLRKGFRRHLQCQGLLRRGHLRRLREQHRCRPALCSQHLEEAGAETGRGCSAALCGDHNV